MKQVISFEKDIVFNSDVAIINSISLEHKEKIVDCEVDGVFCVFGNYKIHNDTTELENFKFDLPYSTLLPNDVISDSVVVDIDNFVYEIIEDDVLHVKIDFLLEYEINECDQLDKFISENNLFNDENRDLNLNVVSESFNDNIINNEIDVVSDVSVDDSVNSIEMETDVIESVNDEYIIYHIHIVQEGDSIESIMKQYDVSLDYIKEYNDISDIKIGNKLIIPANIDE